MQNVRKVLCGACLVSMTACAGPQAPPANRGAGSATLFTGARVIVGDGSTIEDAAFLVQGHTIMQVGKAGTIQAPPGATTVALTGRTVMPAMVNA